MAEIIDPFRKDNHVRPLADVLREVADKIEAGGIAGFTGTYADTDGDLHFICGFPTAIENVGAAIYLAQAAMSPDD